jgi:murein DD-endopeptidase MepM/ murein hydrolase activator NlpD
VVPHFPRTARSRALAALLAGSVLLGLAAMPVASADDLKHKKHVVQKKIAKVNSSLDDSSAQLRKAAAALSSAQTQLAAAQDHLAQTRGELAAAQVLDDQMQAKLAAAVLRLRQARADLAAGRRKVAKQQKALSQIVVQNYQGSDPGLMGLSMVLTSQDATDLTGQLNSVQNVIDKESVTLDRLEATRALLSVQAQEVQDAKAEVAKQRKAAAQNLLVKEGLETQAQAAAAQVTTLVSLRATAQQEAAKAKAADEAQLHGLQKEQDRIAVMLRKRAEEARARAAAAARRAGQAGGPILGDSGPVRSNGFLNWPASGPITSPYGWRINPITHLRSLHDGIDIGIPCGTPLRAPAGGRVIEEYYQTAWGNRAILDLGYHHGVGLAVIFNHMSGYVAHTGEKVSRGQIVGYSGTTGWSTGCHLHFTVMANGVAVNPLNWL